jgi:CAAX prenyl protease-like protein
MPDQRALTGKAAGTGLGRAAWARILPFATYMAFVAMADVLGRIGFDAHALRSLYGVKVAAVVLVLAVFWRDYTELGRAALRPAAAVAAVAAGIAVLVLWVSLDAGWMQIGASSGFDPTDGGRIDWSLVAMRIAGAALVVPLMEELFWRSFLLRWIAEPDFLRAGPAAAGLKGLLISSVLFGFEHNLWLAGIVAGLAYGALYMRYRSIWAAIAAHAVTNGLLGAWVVHTGNWHYW